MDGVNWSDVEGGKVFSANNDYNSIVTNTLASPVSCKAFRIYIQSFNIWPSMRSEIIILNN